MKKRGKFIIGGILIALAIIMGNWFLSFLINPPSGSGIFGRIVFPIIFLIILIVGLDLMADSLIKK